MHAHFSQPHHGRLAKTQIARCHPKMSNSRSRVDLRIRMSNTVPDDADAVGLGTTLGELLL